MARSALAGAATGGRAFAGLVAVVASAPRHTYSPPDRVLAARAVRAGLGAIMASEIVMDKLPSTPSRLEARGLSMRIAFAAASGAVIARRQPAGSAAVVTGATGVTGATAEVSTEDVGTLARTALCVGAALGASIVSATLGVRWRGWLSGSDRQKLLGAATEDIVVASLAGAAAR